jgi:hypothetical protein
MFRNTRKLKLQAFGILLCQNSTDIILISRRSGVDQGKVDYGCGGEFLCCDKRLLSIPIKAKIMGTIMQELSFLCCKLTEPLRQRVSETSD